MICPSLHAGTRDESFWFCTLEAQHAMPHEAGGGGGRVYATWTDDPDDDQFAEMPVARLGSE